MKFCTSIHCMDGRVQLPVIEYLQNRFDAPYVDSITEAGPIEVFSNETNTSKLDSILGRVNISVNNHKSGQIAIVGHHDCAGNPVPRDVQENQIRKGLKYLGEKYPDKEIIGLYVDENFEVQPVLDN